MTAVGERKMGPQTLLLPKRRMGVTTVGEGKMSLVWKKVEVSKILRFFGQRPRRREPLLLVILISLERALLIVMVVFENNVWCEDETRQKDESMSNPLYQN